MLCRNISLKKRFSTYRVATTNSQNILMVPGTVIKNDLGMEVQPVLPVIAGSFKLESLLSSR